MVYDLTAIDNHRAAIGSNRSVPCVTPLRQPSIGLWGPEVTANKSVIGAPPTYQISRNGKSLQLPPCSGLSPLRERITPYPSECFARIGLLGSYIDRNSRIPRSLHCGLRDRLHRR